MIVKKTSGRVLQSLGEGEMSGEGKVENDAWNSPISSSQREIRGSPQFHILAVGIGTWVVFEVLKV
jgi:hypothetical protein